MGTAQFKTHKEKYLNDHVIRFKANIFYPEEPCVDEFELEKVNNAGGGPKTYFLSLCGTWTDKKSPRIKAAWLPWKDGKTTAIDLGETQYDKVEYFFTSELSGCRLEIGTADRPKVLHIAANIGNLYTNVDQKEMTPEMTAKVTARMNEEAENAFGTSRHRKYSRGSAYGKNNVTVVGFRRGGRWDFWGQGRFGLTIQQVQFVRRIVTMGDIPDQ
jgi:hypothetical protein